MRVLTWNLEWKGPRGTSPAASSIRQTLRRLDVDLACLTETQLGWLPDSYEASGLPDPRRPARRKVVVWSRWPLGDIDGEGPGDVADLRRWCAATTHTPSGPIRLFGVVIPYAHSNVVYGTGAARAWEDYARYLNALDRALAQRDTSMPTAVFGDFNQRLDGGRSRVPIALRRRLREVFRDFCVATADLTAPDSYLLDHIAVDGITAQHVALVPSIDDDVRRSDHHGAYTDTHQLAANNC